MMIHIVALYGACAVFLALTFYTWRPRKRPIWIMWPFFALASVEALMLSASGHLIAQWLLPLVTMAVVAGCSGSDRLVRIARPVLIVVAVTCSIHGWYLLGHGYVATGPVTVKQGRSASVAWHTPLTGLRPVQ